MHINEKFFGDEWLLLGYTLESESLFLEPISRLGILFVFCFVLGC